MTILWSMICAEPIPGQTFMTAVPYYIFKAQGPFLSVEFSTKQ
jgi:hypothetical protein